MLWFVIGYLLLPEWSLKNFRRKEVVAAKEKEMGQLSSK